MVCKIVIAFALLALVAAAPQSQEQRQVVPGAANVDQQEQVAPAEGAKDLQGSASIGYGYYGGYPLYSGYSSYYGSYPHYGYGGYPYYQRGFGGLYGGYWY